MEERSLRRGLDELVSNLIHASKQFDHPLAWETPSKVPTADLIAVAKELLPLAEQQGEFLPGTYRRNLLDGTMRALGGYDEFTDAQGNPVQVENHPKREKRTDYTPQERPQRPVYEEEAK